MFRRDRLPVLFVLSALLLFPGGMSRIDAQQASAKGGDLSLKSFLHSVVLTNPDIEKSRLQWLMRTRQADGAVGDFEPRLDASYEQKGLRQQNTALQLFQQLGTSIYNEKNIIYSLGMSGNLPTGATYNLGVSLTRLQDTYVEQGQYQTFVGVSAQQPLLKGATHGAPTASLKTAFQDRALAFQDYRKQLMSTIAQAEVAYWNLAFAQEASRMAIDSVSVARYLLQVATEGVRLGKMSNLDLRQAQAELASRLATQDDRRLAVGDAETSLRLLLGGRAAAEDIVFIASDSLLSLRDDSEANDAQKRELLAWAERAQPDYMIAVGQLDRERILLGYQEDQRLPELDVSGRYGYTGLGATVHDSFDSVGTQGYPTWSVGLELKVPLLLGIKQRNDLEAERLKMRLAVVQVDSVREQMAQTISQLVRDVATLRAQVKNAQTISSVKKELLDVDIARLKNGTMSLVDVYNAQDALDESRAQELRSVVNFRTAVMKLEATSGTILRDQGLESLDDGQVTLSEELRAR